MEKEKKIFAQKKGTFDKKSLQRLSKIDSNLKKKKKIKKVVGGWFWQRKKSIYFLLHFLKQGFSFMDRRFKERFARSMKFRLAFFKSKGFKKFIKKMINKKKIRIRKLLNFFLRTLSLKGTMYQALSRFFADRNKLELLFLSLRTKKRGNPLLTMIITPKLLGEFITKKLDQRHKLKDIIFPIMRALGRNEGISGFKMTCSGRFTRAERATYKWYRSGKLSLNSVRAPLIYDFTEKSLKFGMISIKIWLQYNLKALKEYYKKRRRELIEVK